jgi:hypothetical protein
MKNFLWSVVIASLAFCSSVSYAEDFLGAPVIPGGTIVSQTDDRLEKTYNLSYDSAVNFYREALKEYKDVKFRDRGGQIVIEEYSNRPWHSVTITKVAEDKTEIVLMKDNWTWIMGTLTLRFFGVFAVLMVLYVVLLISGAIISRIIKDGKVESAKPTGAMSRDAA